MRINISKIDFRGITNSGGNDECASLINYSEKEYNNAINPINNIIAYTNKLAEEWDASNTNANDLYKNNKEIIYAPVIDTSNVTSMNMMFTRCSELKYIPKYNTSNVTDMWETFSYCTKLISVGDLNKWDVGNVTRMKSMFNGCSGLTTLDLSNWNNSKVTDISTIFSNCEKLTSINLKGWDTSRVTNMYGVFNYCEKLTSLDLTGWDFSSIRSALYNGVHNMFANTEQLTTINLTNAKMGKMNGMQGMFNNSYVENLILDGVTLPDTQLNNVGFDSNYINLTVDSLLGIINALPITTNGYTLTLGSKHLDKLTDEQKAIATNKGWVLN